MPLEYSMDIRLVLEYGFLVFLEIEISGKIAVRTCFLKYPIEPKAFFPESKITEIRITNLGF